MQAKGVDEMFAFQVRAQPPLDAAKPAQQPPRNISINEINSWARLMMATTFEIRRLELELSKTKDRQNGGDNSKNESNNGGTLVQDVQNRLDAARKKQGKIKSQMARLISANERAYFTAMGQELLADGSSTDGAKISAENKNMAEELANRVSVDNACINFIESKTSESDFLSDVISAFQKRKDALDRHYERLIKIVNWLDRLKEQKNWLKPFSSPKIGAVAGAGASVLDILTNYAEPFLASLENYVKLYPKSPEGKELLSNLVRPLFYVGSSVFLAVMGWLNDLHKENIIRKLEATNVRKQENIDRLRVVIEGLLHLRIMLQVCDIKLGQGQSEDVKRYNREYAARFKNNAWERFYKKEVGENWQQMQDILGKVELGPVRRMLGGGVQMLKDSVWVLNAGVSHLLMRVGDAIDNLSWRFARPKAEPGAKADNTNA